MQDSILKLTERDKASKENVDKKMPKTNGPVDRRPDDAKDETNPDGEEKPERDSSNKSAEMAP